MSIEGINVARLQELISDYRWRLNNLYKISDADGNEITFKLNPAQQSLDDNLHYRNLVLKSRQHGITTYACIRALDMALFRPNIRTGIIAHTREDAEKFFSLKVLYAYDRLPSWLKKARPIKRRDMNGTLQFTNESTVEVSVSHRGGTLQFLHISEYGPMWAKYPERAKEVKSGALNTVHGDNLIIIESTAAGTTGDFHDRCVQAMDHDQLIRTGNARLTQLDYKFHFFGWHQDRVKNKTDPRYVAVTKEMEEYFEAVESECDVALTSAQRAWYVKIAAGQGDDMKREHPSTPKEAFEASVEGAYFGKWMEKAAAEGRVGVFPHNPAKPVHTFWDIGRRDGSAIWFMQENGGWYDFIGYWHIQGEQAPRCYEQIEKYRIERKYQYGTHFLPHDAKVVDWIGKGNQTRIQVLEDMGLKNVRKVERIPNKMEAIDMTRRILHRCRFDAVNCGPPKAGAKERGGIEALKNYRKEWNEQTETFSETEKKDWTNEGADAFMQFAQSYQDERPSRAGEKTRDQDNWKTA